MLFRKLQKAIKANRKGLGMAGEWIETTIGEQATLQRGIDITKAEQRDGKVPVISSGGISSYHDTVAVKGPGVVLGRKGVVGSVFFVEEDYWPHDTSLWVKDFHGNHPRFVYYFFKSIARQISRMDVGSANPTLNRNHVHPMPITWPPLAEQKAIVAVLGALDDKIELNRRMNATLEAMARALFQSWFVDFDPVRAKLDGRKPDGLDKATAALFPSTFQDSPLGPIPRGWEVKRIEEVVEDVYDGPHATPATSDTGPIFLGIGNLTGTALDLSDIRHINEDEWARWTKRVTPKAGDIVPPNIRCCLGRRLALIRPLERDGFPHFWFQQFVSLPFQQFLDQHTIQGATVNRIPLIAFPGYPVLNPPTELKASFERYAELFWQRIHSNQAESRTLATLRDTLLPKLLSGELSVTDEKQRKTGCV
jgi:type I restriction enzyme S subunit